jgi:hypothetical protein
MGCLTSAFWIKHPAEVMRQIVPEATPKPCASVEGTVEIISRDELALCRRWACAFTHSRKDHRYYEIVEDTIPQGLEYRYFVIKDQTGEARAVQPFFIVDQDILVGASLRVGG